MHELGICDALLKMVRNIAAEESLEEITRITVEVGSLSGVVPAYMSDCWEAVTDGTELQDVEFVVEELEGTACCLDCGEEFPADAGRLRCLDIARAVAHEEAVFRGGAVVPQGREHHLLGGVPPVHKGGVAVDVGFWNHSRRLRFRYAFIIIRGPRAVNAGSATISAASDSVISPE